MRFNDLTGLRFNRLLVLKKSDVKTCKKIHWECICDCGKNVCVTTQMIKSGKTKSCGCYKSEIVSIRNTKHGLYSSKAHLSWTAMKNRCYYKKNKDYYNYGARGIRVCDEWLNDFNAFLRDMGHPKDGETLDRIDPNKNYTKENCRWATREIQSANRRSVKKYEHNGVVMHLAAWARRLGINQSTLADRISKWPIERALSERPFR